MNPVRNSIPAQPPIAAQPVVAQPTGPVAAEVGLSPIAQPGTESDRVESKSTVNHPGYHTSDYARLRANMLAIRNQSNLSAEMMLNNVKRLVNYMYSFTKVLASPNPGADFEVVKMWRYARNGTHVIARANMLNIVIEILFFFKTFGNPVEGDEFITPTLDCMKLHHSLVKGEFLRGWVEDKIVQLTPEAVIDKLDAVTKSEMWALLRKFLNVLDNCGQLTARLPQSMVQPCYKFISNSGEPSSISDVFNLGMSMCFNRALNTLVMHVKRPHTPLLGVNQINTLLKSTGISLNKFTSFAQVDSRAMSGKESDNNYPSSIDLLNLCGLPLPAQEQAAEIQQIILSLIEKINHLINVQIQTAQQIDKLRNIILQTSCINRAVSAILPGLTADNTDQSIDSLLAEDVEQREPVTQLQASNNGQVYGASYATPPPTADILAASVDSIMVDDDIQEQRRNKPEPQVPIDDVMEDLEHSIRT